MRFTVSLSKRLFFLLFAFILGYVLVAALGFIIQKIAGPNSIPTLRILMVIQDLFLFIAPALLTAVIITRQPAELLQIDRRPFWPGLLIGLCVMICSIPAMNLIISLNQAVPLPESLEHTFRQMEDNAAAMVDSLYAGHAVGSLVMGILIVAILAALSEEILFRGALQRILSTGGVNVHAAIWIAALVFSAMHLQFYGIVPRLLLGAFFGYMLYWSRSLWVPIILHAFNNALYVFAQWLTAGNADAQSSIDSVGATNTASSITLAIASLALTAVGIFLVRRTFLNNGKLKMEN